MTRQPGLFELRQECQPLFEKEEMQHRQNIQSFLQGKPPKPLEGGEAPANHSRKPEINLLKIESELRLDAPDTPIKVRKHNGSRVSIMERDKGVTIHINPKKIRTQSQLDEVIRHCQRSILWTY